MSRRSMRTMTTVASLLMLSTTGIAGPPKPDRAETEPVPQLLLHFDDRSGQPADRSGYEQVIANHGAKAGLPGRFGTAYEFDGNRAYVDAGNNYGISFAFGTETIEFWINPQATGREMGIIGSQEKPTQSSWRWNVSREPNGTITFRLWDGEQEPKTRAISSTTAAPADRWTHVAVTLDSGPAQTMCLYINGKRETTDTLKSVAAYGSLFIGGANAGFFEGKIDEVAIYDSVLPEELIVRHALGTRPITDGPTAGPNERGFRIFPVDSAATVAVRHTAFPGKSWILRVPEHAYRDPQTNTSVRPSGIVWTRLEDGSLEFHWEAPHELKKKYRLDYWGNLKADGDVIDYQLTGKNAGDKPWGESPWRGALALVCLIGAGNPEFHDYDAQRTYVRQQDRWITMHEVQKGKFASHRMATVPVKKHGQPGAERLAAKVSADGRWVMGIATDTADSLSFNFQLNVSCMHSNPAWPPLEPGEEATAKGRIYILKGDLDALWQRYQTDVGK